MTETDQPAGDQRLDELDAEARYARERYELYRARVHSSRPASPERLRTLKRDAERAEDRLARARHGRLEQVTPDG